MTPEYINRLRIQYLYKRNDWKTEQLLVKILFLVFVLSMFLSVQSIYGQKGRPYDNTLSLLVSPSEATGVGLAYSFKCIYISACRGTYKLPDGGWLDDHYKVSAGYVYMETVDRISHLTNFYSAGVNYNFYGHMYYKTLEMNPNELFPVSFEIGAGAGVGRVVGMFHFDPLKWEASISVGISF
jgi:hypothetical protein